jgi:hypothetical protein
MITTWNRRGYGLREEEEREHEHEYEHEQEYEHEYEHAHGSEMGCGRVQKTEYRRMRGGDEESKGTAEI